MTLPHKISFISTREENPLHDSTYFNKVHGYHSLAINKNQCEISDEEVKNTVFLGTGRGIVAHLQMLQGRRGNHDVTSDGSPFDSRYKIKINEGKILIIDWNLDICIQIYDMIRKHPKEFTDKEIIICHTDITKPREIAQIRRHIENTWGESVYITRAEFNNIPALVPPLPGTIYRKFNESDIRGIQHLGGLLRPHTQIFNTMQQYVGDSRNLVYPYSEWVTLFPDNAKILSESVESTILTDTLYEECKSDQSFTEPKEIEPSQLHKYLIAKEFKDFIVRNFDNLQTADIIAYRSGIQTKQQVRLLIEGCSIKDICTSIGQSKDLVDFTEKIKGISKATIGKGIDKDLLKIDDFRSCFNDALEVHGFKIEDTNSNAFFESLKKAFDTSTLSFEECLRQQYKKQQASGGKWFITKALNVLGLGGPIVSP